MNRRHFFGLLPGIVMLSSIHLDDNKQFRPIYMFRDLYWERINWLNIKEGMIVKIEFLPEENKEDECCLAASDGYYNKDGIPCFVSEPMRFLDAKINFEMKHPRRSGGKIICKEITIKRSER